MSALSFILCYCLVFLHFIHFGWAKYPWEATGDELVKVQSRYANSKSGIFFLMDNSGSLTSQNGFAREKQFIKALMDNIKVAKQATRVAVVRFGDDATIDINYISNLDGLNNKCEFKTAFDALKFTGWMTNMHSAFDKVIDILYNGATSKYVRPWKNINPNSQVKPVYKVVFLITDGRWNNGGDPTSVINRIKNAEQIELFTVGVAGADRNFLQNAATSSNHYFYVDNFNDFSNMATYIRGDPYQVDYDAEQVPTSKCRTACDRNARCGCGLLSGNYMCICNLGYYGNGAVGNCALCAPGTYKTSFDLAESSCTDCPENSNHTKYGSTTVDDCKCNKGYEGKKSGTGCFSKTCPGLGAPDNGYTNPTTCTTKYSSICVFKCNDEFRLVGQEKYTCTVRDDNEGQAFWDQGNIAPTCQRIVCDSSKSQVDNAEKTCDTADFRVRTTCTYECNDGYRLVGSGTKECQGDGTWSGQDTRCQLITCSHLNAMGISTVNNPNCIDEAVRPVVYTTCEFTCPKGYVFEKAISQTVTRYCKEDGQWNGMDDVCIDKEAPRFTSCPSKQIVTTSFRTNVAKNVQWEIPTYYDNSIAVEGDQLTLVENSSYTSPRDFEIGDTLVKYIVRDKGGLEDTCQFQISVEDKEAPYYTYCPEDIKQQYKADDSSLGMRVSWPKAAEFKDNSGKDPTIIATPASGSFFKKGQNQVSYTARDESGNKNLSCQFQIILEVPSCEKRKEPKNGAVACFQAGESKYCNPFCQEGYDFSYKPEGTYFCYLGIWQYWRGFYQVIMTEKENWPDCALRQDPSSGSLKMSQAFYYQGNCNDKDVQEQLKSNYHRYLLTQGPAVSCRVHRATCIPENIQIYCGATDLSRRRRRGVNEMEVHIRADYVVTPDTAVKNQKDFQDLKSQMSSEYVTEVENKAKKINWKTELDQNLTPKSSDNLKVVPEPYCSGVKGSVIGRCDDLKTNCDNSNFYECQCHGESGSIEKCIECPIGKYYDINDEKCKLCINGTYQDEEGHFNCKPCEPGFYTLGNDEKNFTACREICKAGYYSSTGLAPCRPCPLGQYSSDTFATSCKTCPSGTLTVLPAAAKIEECGMKCAPGTYSASGVEPCQPCEKGFYQPDEGKLSCFPCKGKTSTYGPGAKSESFCLEIDNCASNPCNNGGKCVDAKDNYQCECKSGFRGKNCDDEVGLCHTSPCYSSAQCVDKVNGYKCLCAPGMTGVNCDESIPQCGSNPCKNNAECVEVPGSYECKCKNGWTGRFCEVNRDDCSPQPCMNGGICRDKVDGFTCECAAGYKGDRCEIDIDDCSTDPCGQNGVCQDKINGYICECLSGYTGEKCEIRALHCSSSPCRRGKCVEKEKTFECQCPPRFGGESCEQEYYSDYDLTFTTSEVKTYSKRSLYQDLHAFTIAFWLRTSDETNAGTPLSYSVKLGNYIQDNGLVLKDYGNLAVEINNQTGITGDQLNDGQWHHVAITWRSSNGIWVYYRDGKEISRALDAVAKGDYIRGGGQFVLAQEQDWEVADQSFSYNAYEAFLGDMSQMTVWNTVLSPQDIYNLAGSCKNARDDAVVISWADFVPNLSGVYKKSSKSYACDFSSSLRRFTTVYNADLPSNDQKTLTGVTPEECATACNQETGFHCRSFDYDSAAKKCFLSQAYRDIVSISSGDNNIKDYYELNCIGNLGVESRLISDSQMSATSQNSPLSGAKEGRIGRRKTINIPGETDSEGGWIPSSFSQSQYLQIDIGRKVKITAVETQGADQHNYWVKTYQVKYSVDGASWSTVSQTFNGNTDNKGRKKNQVNIQARYIRFLPMSWNSGIGMRVELYGCSIEPEGVPTDLISVTRTHSGSCSPNPCKNGATCDSVPYGHVCKCLSGYIGRNCETEMGCNDPGIPYNGIRSSSTFTAKSKFQYSCKSGYKLVGESNFECSRGTWSSTQPKCENINECADKTSGCNQHCTDFPGSFRCSCTAGYRLNSDGKTCEDINECQENVCSHVCINSKGSFQCTCPANMVLRKSQTRCEDKNECASNNGGCSHHCVNTYSGRRCYCRHGYSLQSNGVSCKEIRCPSPQNIQNGQYQINGDPIFGNSVSFSCVDGYKLVGSDSRNCDADGKWDGVQPVCKAVKCVGVGTVVNAKRQMTGNGNDYKNRVTYTCHSSYRLLGSSVRRCEKSSTWSGNQPFCVANHCPALQAPANGRINGFRSELDATVGVACDYGYTAQGTSFRTCQNSGQWSGSDPTCELVDCGDPGTPNNGYRQGNYFKFNSTINFSCKEKHHLEGARHVTCQANGKWTAPAPECLARSCGDPGTPYNGAKIGTQHTYGKNVSYICRTGYRLVGDRVRICNENTAKWTGSTPSCKLVDCGDLPDPANGFKFGSSFTYNEVLVFDCNPGYKLVGNRKRRCQETGSWSGTAPTCVATSCGTFMNGPSGEIKSPNFPSQYNNDLYCTWKITVPTGKKVRIEFSDFKTEPNDIVYVYDTDKSEPIVQFSGLTYIPRVLTSSGKSLRIRFVSNGDTINPGFHLTYSQVDCGGMLSASSGAITSPNFQGQYPSNLDCRWLIHIPGEEIDLSFSDFHTQQSYDRVEIYTGPKSTDKKWLWFSGVFKPYGSVRTFEYMYVRFVTSAQNDQPYRGFRAVYKKY